MKRLAYLFSCQGITEEADVGSLEFCGINTDEVMGTGVKVGIITEDSSANRCLENNFRVLYL